MGIRETPGTKKVLFEIENLSKSVEKNIRRGLYQVGKQLKQTASDNIKKKGRSGRVYKYKGRRHVASTPNESWANRSGKARRGIEYAVRGSDQLRFGNDVDYTKYLEFGTKNMEPRPSHLISIEQNNRNIINILDDAVKKGFGK